MRLKMQRLFFVMCGVISLFIITNFVIYLSNSNNNINNLIHGGIFIIILYGWSLYRIVTAKIFSIGFLDFVNIIYAVGFISNITIAGFKLTGVIVPIIISLSLCGIYLNYLGSKVARNYVLKYLPEERIIK